MPLFRQQTAAVRSETISPIRNASFNKGGSARVRKQGGTPVQGPANVQIFEGSTDGNRQVDPQIAVGGGHILHGTNNGFVIYDKRGTYRMGVPQSEFNQGIDPKMVFHLKSKTYVFDLWNPWDDAKKKPVNVSVSETSDPTGAWNTYPVPAPGGVDGGAIGASSKWIGYSFPGGPEQTFVMSLADARAGKPVQVYHFAGNLGHPVNHQDDTDDILFFQFGRGGELVITTVGAGPDGAPVIKSVVRKPHGIEYMQFPPQAAQKGTDKRTASGDRNPKNVVLQSKHLWFAQTVNVDGRAAVQWHQLRLDGTFVQSGRISHTVNSYIEASIGVNKDNDVLVGFQEAGPDMFISPRCAFRAAGDAPGTTRGLISLGEGLAATEGGAWGDYSCTTVDGDNGIDLWTIQSMANAKGRGDCRIAKIDVKAMRRK